ncbi:MAG TPA: LysE family translocator [Myxococcota bacterium]|nr:LysE family translocator [Myxococcota bacterium]
MTLETWLLFCATDLVLSLTPGIAVTLVISSALGSGAREGLLATLGILVANALYFALSATGVGALLAASPRVFELVRWAGAAYLVVLGVQAIRAALAKRPLQREATSAASESSARGAFLRGFVMQAANPKALLFFVAILPQFVTPGGNVAFQILVLGASSIAIEIVVLSLYALAAARARLIARDARFGAALDATSGALLVFAGIGLAALRP